MTTSIESKNYELRLEGKELYYRLGNWTDAGWCWSGTTRDKMFLLFLQRAKSCSEALKDLKEFDAKTLQRFYKKACKDKGERKQLAYNLAGDNNLFHFGGLSDRVDNEAKDIIYSDSQEGRRVKLDDGLVDYKGLEANIIETVVSELELPDTVEEFLADNTWLPDIYESIYYIISKAVWEAIVPDTSCPDCEAELVKVNAIESGEYVKVKCNCGYREAVEQVSDGQLFMKGVI